MKHVQYKTLHQPILPKFLIYEERLLYQLV
jgi:hypothetical protein